MAKWMVYQKKEDFRAIAEACGISQVLARLIRNRDVIGIEQTRRFLHGGLEDLHDPLLLPDMEKAVRILSEKIRAGASVRVIGDYDVDGICASYILMQIYTATLNMGIYYMTYVLKNANLLGVFSWAINIPMIIGLLFTPALVAKFGGMYKLNLMGYTLGTIGRLGVVIAGYMGSVPLMLVCTAVAAIGMSPLQGDMNALIATCSEYTYLTHGKRVDGTMYSCTSLGTKLGGGIGTALAGWLLAFS